MKRRIPAAALILAGGRSSRMGRSKHSLRVGGVRVLDRMAARLQRVFPRVYVAQGTRALRLPAGARGVRDLAPRQGPLGVCTRHSNGPGKIACSWSPATCRLCATA